MQIQQQIENFGKIKIKKILKKNCWEVVWPPLGLCRGGGGGVPCGLLQGHGAQISPTTVNVPCRDSHPQQNGCKTDGNDRLAVLAARAAGKRARAFQKTTGRRLSEGRADGGECAGCGVADFGGKRENEKNALYIE